MFFNLVLLFTIVPALELMLLIKVGTYIGAANTVLLIILTGVLGAALARMQGFIVLQKIQRNMQQGILPSDELIDGLMILIGGIVLLTPGFMTDFMGLLLLIPWTRAIIKALVKLKFEQSLKSHHTGNTYQFTTFRTHHRDSKSPFGEQDVEEGEFRE